MVDTIIFKIHDLYLHERLVQLLHKKGLEGKSQSMKYVDVKEAEENFMKRTTVNKFFTEHLDGHVVEAKYQNHIPSWNYDIAYSINFLQQYIEVNLSIPKYLYGTNVFQFIPHHFDRGHEYYFSAEHFEEVKDDVYRRLKAFLAYFIKKHFGEGMVNEYFVQICQIDICYNKFFNSSVDAFEYLADLKRIRKKHIRETTKGKGTYHTGLHFSTSDYAFKIYHKGAEFKEHDRKKLMQRNVWPTPLINQVGEMADRIIRFELSLRNGLLNSLFKDYIFRKDDEQYQVCKKYYNSMVSNDFITNSKGEKLRRHELSRKQKGMINYGKHIANKTFRFYLAADSAFHKSFEYQNDEIEGKRKLSFEWEMRFGRSLWRESWKRFLTFYKEFEVTYEGELLDLISLVSKDAKDDNEKMVRLMDHAVRRGNKVSDIEGHLSFSTIKMIVHFLKTSTWEELKKSELISERQYFRIRRLFKALGIQNVGVVMVPGTKNDFRDYFEAVDRLQTAFNVDKFLKPVTF